MNPKALSKANDRLRVAKKATAELETCVDYDSFKGSWYIFLVSSKNVYTILENGSKASPQSRQWFGAKNQLRKNDPLLRYVTEARNDDEHGIGQTSELIPAQLDIGVSSPTSSRHMIDENGNQFINCGVAYRFIGDFQGNIPRIKSLDGKPVLVKSIPSRVILLKVFDRSRNQYDPPTTHLGQPLTDSSPITVAKAMVLYLDSLLVEARGLCKPLP